MRWQALFDDLEAQLEAAEAAGLAAEVADRTRAESARLLLVDRLAAGIGAPLVLQLYGSGQQRVRLVDTGPDWLLAAPDEGGRELLVPLAALLAVSGLTRQVRVDQPGPVARRLDLRWALRGLARDRSPVSLLLVDGSAVSGTLDRVLSDHVDLAEHPPGELRRAREVRGVRSVSLQALSAVRVS